LSTETCKFVVFGHTHTSLEEPLGNGATYLNTGTWATTSNAQPLVMVETSDGAAVARLRRFERGRIA
jgi:predicted phosphodiesterase